MAQRLRGPYVEDQPMLQILYHPTTTIAFTGDGNGLVACDGKEVLTFNAKSGNFQECFTLPSVNVDMDQDDFNMSTFCLTRDGSEIVITPSWPGGEARVIDVNSGETVSTLHFELCNVGQAVFSANNEFLATYHECEDWEWPMRILLWRGRDFEAVRTALDPDEPGAIKPTDKPEDEFDAWLTEAPPAQPAPVAAAPAPAAAKKPDPYNLRRFVSKAREYHNQALSELRSGHKASCWSWYVLPTPPFIKNGREVGSSSPDDAGRVLGVARRGYLAGNAMFRRY